MAGFVRYQMEEGPCCPWSCVGLVLPAWEAAWEGWAGILALPKDAKLKLTSLWENSCPALKLGQLSPASFRGRLVFVQRGLELPHWQQGEVWAFKMPLNKLQVMTNSYCPSPALCLGE